MRTLIIFWTLIAFSSFAEDLYVAQNAAGADDGTSCANAKALDWLNTSGNWGVGANKVSGGDTVHLCGTFTNALTVQASGSAGNVITIYFEPGAKFSWPAWPPDALGCIRATTKDYITIDGGTDGLIECTDNGTSLTYQRLNDGVAGVDCSYFTVKNLTVKNLYQRTGTTDQLAGCRGIRNTQSSVAWRDFTVTNCSVGNCYYGVYATWGAVGASNVVWAGNRITNCNWGMGMGDGGAGTMRTVNVYGNSISNFSVWDDTSVNTHHHNGFYGFGESGGTLTGVTFHRNIVGPGWGTYTTGGIFVSGGLGAIDVMNNVFLADGTGTPTTGFITFAAYNNSGFVGRAMNNTIVGNGSKNGIYVNWEAGQSTASVSVYTYNNLITDVETAYAQFMIADGVRVVDYNIGYGLVAAKAYSSSSSASANYLTLAQWHSAGGDPNGPTGSNPLLNSANYTVSSISPAIAAGTNLISFAGFSTDYYGNARPSSGNWTIGAYEYVAPLPPAMTIGPGMTLGSGITIR